MTRREFEIVTKSKTQKKEKKEKDKLKYVRTIV